MKLSIFERAYIECALWSSIDDENEPLDRHYTETDLAPETLERVVKDCDLFQLKACELLDDWDSDEGGHDFWLTRNHHGSGFWDRELGDESTRRKLTDLAHEFGESDLYLGDDGKLYFQ